MLLALTRPSRLADLASLHIDRRRISAALTKQSRQSKQLVKFFFPTFPHNNELCPVRTLQCYEHLTEEFRCRKSDFGKLFLSVVKPHHLVTSCTIARWLCEVLKGTGIDVSISLHIQYEEPQRQQPQELGLLQMTY